MYADNDPETEEPSHPTVASPDQQANRVAAIHRAVASAVFVVLSFLWVALPDGREFLSKEAGPIETVTVVLYLAGLAISLGSLPSARRRQRPRAGYWLLAGLCLVAALDEVSWGAEVIPGLPLPVVLGVRVDSIHDVVEIGQAAVRRVDRRAAALVFGALLLAAGVAAFFLRASWRPWARRFASHGLRLRLVALAVGLGVVAQAMDVLRVSVYLEETLELEAALALVFAAVAGVVRAPSA